MKLQNRSIFSVERIQVRGSFNNIGGIVDHHNSNKGLGNTEGEITKGNPEKNWQHLARKKQAEDKQNKKHTTKPKQNKIT